MSVEDNGPGIPAHLLPDIFGAFVTTRLDARGTGLGLTVAEGIVTQHGGLDLREQSGRRRGVFGSMAPGRADRWLSGAGC